MSRLSSLFSTSLLGGHAHSPRDRQTDGLTRLRFALETMASSRKFVFSPAARIEVLAELYQAFWGIYPQYFLPPNVQLPIQGLLSEVQNKHGFAGAGAEEKIVPGRSCGHIFMKGESCYRCKDCALDDSCVMCSRCFHATDHTHHNVTFYICQQSGGCCDCGDVEAWRRPINCKFHPPADPSKSQSQSQATPKPTPKPLFPLHTNTNSGPSTTNLPSHLPPLETPHSLPPELLSTITSTISYAIDFCLDTLDYSPTDPSLPESLSDIQAQYTADPAERDVWAAVLWNDEKHSVDEVARGLVQSESALIGVGVGLGNSGGVPGAGSGASGLGGGSGGASAMGAAATRATAQTLYSTTNFPNFSPSPYPAAPVANPANNAMNAPTGVSIHTRPSHSVQGGVQTPITSTISPQLLTNLLHQIEHEGRATIAIASLSPHLFSLGKTLSQTDLAVTIRRAYDVFREGVVGVIIEWLLDLMRCRIWCSRETTGGGSLGMGFGFGFGSASSNSGFDGITDDDSYADPNLLKELVLQQLLASRTFGIPSISNPEPREFDGFFASAYPNPPSNNNSARVEPARLDWMYLYHARLWKRARLNLKELYVSMLTLSLDYKLALADHFATVYHRVIDSYLLVDREAETSIKYFALQLFTVPSVARMMVEKHDIVARLLCIIGAFFMNRIRDGRVIYGFPPAEFPRAEGGEETVGVEVGGGGEYEEDLDNPLPSPTQALDPDCYPFKSKRFMPIFSDLRYIIHTPLVQPLIVSSPHHTIHFASTCQLFMCLNPNKRAAENHVEYETDAWISVFNVTLSVSRVIKVWGEAFGSDAGNATPRQLVDAISIVIHHILQITSLSDPRLDKIKFKPLAYHTIPFARRQWEIVKFDVMEEWISFHHSLHWLLAELFKHVDILDDEVLANNGFGDLRTVVERHADGREIIGIVDFPLRVLAMIAQIRVGLWVRNGFVIRGQLLHYRDFMLRELCYDQDLFILQAAFKFLPSPSLVLVSLLDRFQLSAWFTGNVDAHSLYDNNQLYGMIEELFYVLVVILGETGAARRMPLPEAVRREIVHALAVGPCSYTDLVKRVAERMVDDVCFDHVLRAVTHFRAPDGTADTGIYELRDEVYDEVDPFFYHYTRNKREEVERILRARYNRRRKDRGLKEEKEGEESEPLYVPKPLGISKGPFQIISRVYEEEVFIQILFHGINNLLLYTKALSTTPPSTEAVLDQAIHLVMLGTVERQAEFAKVAAEYRVESIVDSNTTTDPRNHTLLDVLCEMEDFEKFKSYKSRVRWVLDQWDKWVPERVRAVRKIPERDIGGAGAKSGRGGGKGKLNADEARKRAAKARQEMIMRQMKAQQSSFALNLNLDEEDKEMEDVSSVSDHGPSGGPSTAHTSSAATPYSFGVCIVCQEELDGSKGFGSLGMVQPSRVLRRHVDGSNYHLNDALGASADMDRQREDWAKSQKFSPADAEAKDLAFGSYFSSSNSTPSGSGFPSSASSTSSLGVGSASSIGGMKPNTSALFDGYPAPYTRFGLHASVCSHMMHLDCFQVYNVSIKQRHRTQGQRNHPESIARKEYLCPLCKSLGNVVVPVVRPQEDIKLSEIGFADWIRSAGITILKSRPDPLLDSLQFRTGTGEFVFWSAQDTGYVPFAKNHNPGSSSNAAAAIPSNATAGSHPNPNPNPGTIRFALASGAEGGTSANSSSSTIGPSPLPVEKENSDWHKMLDTMIVVTKNFSQQTRHLRERPEPEIGERGAGLYLPDDLVGYTIGVLEASLRGTGNPGTLVPDMVSEPTLRMIRGLVANLTNLAGLHFKNRADEGRGAIRQAIIKRLLPEWSRTSLTSLSFPLLLRDPLTILVETAAVAPEILRHVLVLLYHVCMARTVIGLVYVLNKSRAHYTIPVSQRNHTDVFGDVRMFCMSVVRHSPVFEHTADIVFESYGEARVEKLLYSFTLPFLRRAAILCRAILPHAFPTPDFGAEDSTLSEHARLLRMLGIPSLAELPRQDTLQTALSGWCAHYGHSHAASQLNCGVILDYPGIYRLVRLPNVLDTLFREEEKAMTCHRCKTIPTDAAICLVCGTVVCMQSHCCRDMDLRERGECNMHTRECGGAVGLYFLVKRCSLLYLHAGSGSFSNAPYMDVHGEVDTLMRRGRRQYLHPARWEDIRKTWLNHGIPTMVARKMEGTVDNGGWETL